MYNKLGCSAQNLKMIIITKDLVIRVVKINIHFCSIKEFNNNNKCINLSKIIQFGHFKLDKFCRRGLIHIIFTVVILADHQH